MLRLAATTDLVAAALQATTKKPASFEAGFCVLAGLISELTARE
jgi:hypothetical protein